ncbi:MAG: tRNA-binding protein [Thermomicrobia bacterium]|nr:tRNA-binding protein [Thermomicrobia bacterium]MCA1725586.1 tRNA-binding protein [Thermomicrobia bacterium]
MATIEDLQRLDIRTGVIVAVENFPRARTPAYRVTVDFGPAIGTRRSSVQATNYGKDALIGMQVVGVVNFPPRNIAGFLSEVLILGVPGEDGALALLTPSRPARVGGGVY